MTEFKRKVEAIVRERGGIVGPLQAWQVSGDALTWWDEQQLGPRPTATEIEAAVPYVPLFSPEKWTRKHFTPMQISALQSLELALAQAAKSLGPNMSALKAWLTGMLVASADPTPRTFDAPPCSYEQAAGEAVAELQ